MNFAIGDVVQLKSGGPLMTVDQSAEGQILCSWFVGAEHKKGKFAAATLERYVEPAPHEPEDYDPYAGGRNRMTGY